MRSLLKLSQQRRTQVARVLRYLLTLMFLTTGSLHFLRPEPFVRIMPPALSYPLALVYASGVAEMGLALLLIPRSTRRLAAWGLVALLVAVFPANIYAAIVAGTDHPAMPHISPLLAWLRLPLQPLMIAWAWWVGSTDSLSRDLKRTAETRRTQRGAEEKRMKIHHKNTKDTN